MSERPGEPLTPVDAEASTPAGGAAKKPRRNQRKIIAAALIAVVLALIVWIIVDAVRAPEAPRTPGAITQPSSTPSSTAGGTGLSPAAATAVDWVRLSYAAKWDQACQLDEDPETCKRVLGTTPAYELVGPITVRKEETYPASGVAGQAYTGVLVESQQKGSDKPQLGAYLIDAQNKIAGFEPISSSNSHLSMREILERHMR